MKESISSKTPPLDLRARQEATGAGQRAGQLPFKRGVLILIFVAVSCTFWFWLGRHDPRIFREHGPMENFQVASLGVGMLFLLRAVLASSASRPWRIFLGSLILFYGTLVLLEFDVRDFRISWLTWWLSGTVRNVWVGLLWLGAFVLFVRHARATWTEFRAWLRTPAATLLLLAGVFWASGWLVDRLKFLASRHQNMMAEELLEANAAPLMLAAAILTWRGTIKTRNSAPHLSPAPSSPEQIANNNAKPSA